MDVWFEPYLRVKPDKVVVKLYEKPGVFKGAVNIPSVMWPLNGPYELFHANNTEFITDKTIPLPKALCSTISPLFSSSIGTEGFCTGIE